MKWLCLVPPLFLLQLILIERMRSGRIPLDTFAGFVAMLGIALLLFAPADSALAPSKLLVMVLMAISALYLLVRARAIVRRLSSLNVVDSRREDIIKGMCGLLAITLVVMSLLFA